MAQEDHGVSDCCVWFSFLASDRMGGRSRQRLSRDKHSSNSSVRWVQKPVDDEAKIEQVHVALLALTESEGFGNIRGAAPSKS